MRTINGTRDADRFVADDDPVTFAGDGGFDSVAYHKLLGGITLSFYSASEALVAKQGSNGRADDVLIGISQVIGTVYADVLNGSRSRSVDGSALMLTGDAGNDTIYGFAEYRKYNFDGYWNVADYSTSTSGIDANLATGVVLDGLGGTDTLVDVISIRGSSHEDTIIGSNGNAWTTLEGMAGNDTIHGKTTIWNGASYALSPTGIVVDLEAGSAHDGWGSVDTLISVARVIGSSYGDSITGAATDDWLQASWSNDTIDGAGGFNTLDYGTLSGSVRVTLTGDGAGTAAKGSDTDGFSNISAIQGSYGSDYLKGWAGATKAVYLRGMVGADTINGAKNLNNIADYQGGAAIVADLGTGTVQEAYASPSTDTLIDIVKLRGSDAADRITGSDRAETLLGGMGADTIIGGGGDDHLDGGLGDDALDGGAGYDTVLFSGTRAATTLTRNADGSWTAVGPEGTDILRNVEAVQFSDGTLQLRAVERDFDGDLKSDILFDSTAAAAPYRTLSQWHVTGGSFDWGTTFAHVDPVWSVAGTGDFNGDGRADLLWHQQDGSASIWLMDGTGFLAGATIYAPSADEAFAIAGVADFDGDGRSDILFQREVEDASGHLWHAVALWEMNGLVDVAGGSVATVDAAWSIAGVADFDGDGHADILWQHADSTISIWRMDGTVFLSGGTVHTPGTGWTVVGTGDLDGDDRADILFRHADGSVAAWRMDGTTVLESGTIYNPGTGWQVAAIGDYDGDYKADLLWRQEPAAGVPYAEMQVWTMDGLSVTQAETLTYLDTAWRIL